MTLELSGALGRKFKAAVPQRFRSKLGAELLAKHLRAVEAELEKAARRAKVFKIVNHDMKSWEALNEAKD